MLFGQAAMRLSINQTLESDILSCTIVRMSRDKIAPTWTTDKKKLIKVFGSAISSVLLKKR